ncbi:MAG: Hsp70 family protein [Desulfuromonadales bacterium]
MKMPRRQRYNIGIDLGTTNCVLAFLPPGGGAAQVLPVPQWEELNSVRTAAALPSFYYLTSAAERAGGFAESAAAPPPADGWVPGVFARNRMAAHAGRVIHSAKSWLSHAAVDRTAPILPWQSEEIPAAERLSPVQASAGYLGWLRRAWNAALLAHDPQADFDAQEVVVTVPASFDEAAQRLTLEAANLAGYPPVRLIEEPQAAFYDWLGRGRNPSLLLNLLETTGGPARVLVCDIGGGTTDFSLFEAAADRDAAGGLALRRLKVSDHLLLGGDNIDLTLAYDLEQRLTGGRSRLTGRQLSQLLVQARELKERILGGQTPDDAEFPLVLAGSGAGLFAGALSARLRAAEVRRIVVDGFFPECGAGERPRRQEGGLREWGLPYAADTAITRHLAAFLEGERVDAVLFNGGAATPGFLRERLHRLLAAWQGGPSPTILGNSLPALAVARGAARYAFLLAHPEAGRRIAGGHAHALYLEVVRGKGKKERSLVCVLPRGMEAGEKRRIANAEFDLLVNQPVRFQCHSSHRRAGDAAGAIVAWNERDFHPLPPLQTAIHLPPERPRPANDRLRVSLECRLNELGLLQLWCVEEDGPGRWRLDFNLRRAIGGEEPVQAPEVPLVPERQLQQAQAVLLAIFGKKKEAALPEVKPRQLPRRLEEILGGGRDGWDSATLRALWPTLAQGMGRRARSVEHEAAWLFLAGWLLRPGYGFALDEARMEELWHLFGMGLAHPGEKRVQTQWHILWRRTAGGLHAGRQEKLLEKLLPALRGGDGLSAEMLYLAGALERLRLARKEELVKLFTAGFLRPRLKTREPYAWALGRLLCRTPLYAGPDAILPPGEVEKLFAKVRDVDWRDPEFAPLSPLFALAARRTDRRDVDVAEALRREILDKMKGAGAPSEQLRGVRETIPVDYEDRVRQFGDSLPAGLILIGGKD